MRLAVVFGIIATVLSPLMRGHGYDSLVRHDLGTAADLAPFATATTADGGLWLLASGDSDVHQLARLDANGNRTAGLFLPTSVDSDNSDRFQIYPLADGGVLELDTHRRSQFETACVLRSVTREGILRFERNVRQPSCSLKVGKLGRAPYLLTNIDGAIVISEDGSLASSFITPGDSSFIRADFVAQNELLLLRTNETRTGYVLSRAGDDGSLRWSNPLENVRFNQNVTVKGLNDGRALGGQLAAVPTQNNAILGRGTVTFSGCANAVLRYQFDDALIAGAFKARTGEINLQRLGDCPAQ